MKKEMTRLDDLVIHTSWNQSGVRMAAALSDGSIQLWDVSTDAASTDDLIQTAHWEAHVGGCCPRIAWAPPEYGDVIASCSAEGAISIWEEVVLDGMIEKTWRQASTLSTAQSSVLDIQFSNSTSALYLLVISADGYARIYMLEDSLNLMKWQLQAEFQNSRSPMEINGKHRFWGASIAWRKSTLMNLQPAFVIGYNSTSHALNSAKVWEFQQAHQRWFCIAELCEADESDKPVNHVSWAQNIGRSHELIAVASGDGVSIWQLKFVTAAENNCSAVRIARLTGFEGEVCQVEWDMSGMTLASSGTDGVVRLWQTNLQGEWKQISQI